MVIKVKTYKHEHTHTGMSKNIITHFLAFYVLGDKEALAIVNLYTVIGR